MLRPPPTALPLAAAATGSAHLEGVVPGALPSAAAAHMSLGAGGLAGEARCDGRDEARWRSIPSLAEHPRLPRFASAGDDGAVKVWSLSPHKLHAARRLRSSPTCLSFSPDGWHLAVGCVDGRLVVLTADQLDLWLERVVMGGEGAVPSAAVLSAGGLGGGGGESGGAYSAAARAAAYSPDGRWLAIGEASGVIRLYLVTATDSPSIRF